MITVSKGTLSMEQLSMDLMPLLGPNVTRPGKLESQPHCKGGGNMLYMTSSVIFCLWTQYTTLLNCCLNDS